VTPVVTTVTAMIFLMGLVAYARDHIVSCRPTSLVCFYFCVRNGNCEGGRKREVNGNDVVISVRCRAEIRMQPTSLPQRLKQPMQEQSNGFNQRDIFDRQQQRSRFYERTVVMRCPVCM